MNHRGLKIFSPMAFDGVHFQCDEVSRDGRALSAEDGGAWEPGGINWARGMAGREGWWGVRRRGERGAGPRGRQGVRGQWGARRGDGAVRGR